MTKLQIYTAKGKASGNMDLPKEYATKLNLDLLTQAIHIYEDRSHKGSSKVKTRSEVNATTAKMYRQKGTGNARHGDRKAPIFKGGGVAHGPKGFKRVLYISKRVGTNALNTALNLKAKEGRVIVLDKLDSIEKTKEAYNLLASVAKELGIKKVKNFLVALSGEHKNTLRFFRNIQGVRMLPWHGLDSYEVFQSNLLMIEKDALTSTPKTSKSESTKAVKLTLAAESKISTSKKLTSKKSQKKETKKKVVKVIKKAVKPKAKKGSKK